MWLMNMQGLVIIEQNETEVKAFSKPDEGNQYENLYRTAHFMV